MSRNKLLILTLLLCSSLALASVELYSFNAYAIVNQSQLEWATGQEGELTTFIIERSSDTEHYFAIAQVPATGSYSEYHFTDTSPLDVDMDRTFYYRLKMVERGGTYSYSSVVQVSLTFSAVQHTWGSIKAMFR